MGSVRVEWVFYEFDSSDTDLVSIIWDSCMTGMEKIWQLPWTKTSYKLHAAYPGNAQINFVHLPVSPMGKPGGWDTHLKKCMYGFSVHKQD
jgi:hypothetical protein